MSTFCQIIERNVYILFVRVLFMDYDINLLNELFAINQKAKDAAKKYPKNDLYIMRYLVQIKLLLVLLV